MAIRDRTYSDLRLQISAICGVDFDSNESKRVDALINLAASRAKRSTDYWERFLVVDEPRTVSRGFVETTEDSFNVFGAGTEEVNGLYRRNGLENAVARYSLYDSEGTKVFWDIEYDGVANWEILVGVDHPTFVAGTVYYTVADPATTPPETGWSSSTGESPTPNLRATADIETALYWTRGADSYRSFHTYEFSSDTYGLRPWGNVNTNGIVYVTYVKKNTEIYGAGTGGTTASIPEEWFDYISLYTSYMHQVSQRQQNNNAGYGIALREVERSLIDQHMRIESQGTPRMVQDNVATRISYSSML